ncbi:YaaL family protein [Oceanobacillus sp. FSL K6-2867]|uniref:YaaL family protein n=1 Tax=Oceanobacillus sp. FSL K6-2867 TaxID=2954748 RepID=UPI0030D7F997
MGKKRKRKDVDNELLDTILRVEQDWKDIQSIVQQSMEPSLNGMQQEAIARAKYLFLLREARLRNVSAVRVY